MNPDNPQIGSLSLQAQVQTSAKVDTATSSTPAGALLQGTVVVAAPGLCNPECADEVNAVDC